MVKELRLAGVSSMAVANAWLPGFITAYNARFGRDPANAKDLHRPLARADDLDEILAWREERTVTRTLNLHHDRMMLILEPTSLARDLVRKKVEVVNYPDGRFEGQFNGAAVGFKVFDKIQTVQPGAIVDNKRLSAVLEQVKAQQAAYPARQQRGHGARQRPPNNLEAPGLPAKGRGAHPTPWCSRSAGRSPPSRPPSRRGEGGFLRDREIYYDARRDDGLATAEWREPTRSDRLPVHRSESPTGYSSAGCSPAEPASASPVKDDISAIPIPCVAVLQCHAGRVTPPTGVSFLLCTPGVISILRRQNSKCRPTQNHKM